MGVSLVDRSNKRHWTEQEIELLKKLYSTTPNPQLAQLLPRTRDGIKRKAQSLGLSKVDEYWSVSGWGQPISREDIAEKAYLAGFFDGEGCLFISVKKPTHYRRGSLFQIKVSVANTKRAALDLFQSRYGGKILFTPKQKLGRQPIFTWQLYNIYKVAYFLVDLLPYLMLRKKQAEVTIDFCKLVWSRTRKGQGAPVPSDVFEELEVLAQQIRSLQCRLPSPLYSS